MSGKKRKNAMKPPVDKGFSKPVIQGSRVTGDVFREIPESELKIPDPDAIEMNDASDTVTDRRAFECKYMKPNQEYDDWVTCGNFDGHRHRCNALCIDLNNARSVDTEEAVEFWGKHGWKLLDENDEFDDEYEGKHRSGGRGCCTGICVHVIFFLNEIPPASNNLVRDHMLGPHP